MKKTETYNLCQWEASDRIRMEDFNADNARLEEALTLKPGRMELLHTYENHAGDWKAGHAFHMKPEDFNKWEYLIYVSDLHKTAFTDKDGMIVRLQIGDSYTQTYIHGPSGSYAILFAPRHDAARPIRAMVVGATTGPLFFDEPYSELKGAIMTLDWPTDTRFTTPQAALYGIR